MNAALWPDVIGRLLRREDLPDDLIEQAMSEILSGDATDAQIAAFAVGLRAKGETAGELAALVRTMLEFAERVDLSDLDAPLVDTCGTGGDGAGTVNVSTMAAVVTAAAGARVAKHGGRAASSKCGSVDVLETLGVVIDLGPEGVARCVREVGIGFCFAQRFHPAMRFAAPVRSQLGTPTTFNFLGPLANPAGATPTHRRRVGSGDGRARHPHPGRRSGSSGRWCSSATTGSTSSRSPRRPPSTSSSTATSASPTSTRSTSGSRGRSSARSPAATQPATPRPSTRCSPGRRARSATS